MACDGVSSTRTNINCILIVILFIYVYFFYCLTLNIFRINICLSKMYFIIIFRNPQGYIHLFIYYTK